MEATMLYSVGRAGQPGYVVVKGEKVFVRRSGSGYFIENLQTKETVFVQDDDCFDF